MSSYKIGEEKGLLMHDFKWRFFIYAGRRSVSSEWIYISRRNAQKAGKAFAKELQKSVTHGGNSGTYNGPIIYETDTGYTTGVWTDK